MAAIGQPSFDAPPHKWYPGKGGQGIKIGKIHWGIILCPKKKMMIYKGLDIRYHTLGCDMRMTPQKGGGYMTHAPAPDLTTLIPKEVDSDM